MKSRIMLTVLVIALAAALIAGATAAWFTAETTVPEAEFKAGTVVISADEEVAYAPAPGKHFQNVNPGDCGKITWTIVNEGTKKIELRVLLSKEWEYHPDLGVLSANNVYYAPAPDSGWEMYDDNGSIWLYYTGGPVAGTFDNDNPDVLKEPTSVELPLIVAFDGPNTGNEYQGKWFELSGKVEAVQASNEAPAAVWGGAWTAVKATGYEPDGLAKTYLDYIKGTECGKGGQEPDEPGKFNVSAVIEEEGNGSVTGTGSFAEGDEVELEAIPVDGYQFVRWELPEGLALTEGTTTSATIKFNMPDEAVTVTAVFEKIDDRDGIIDDYDFTGSVDTNNYKSGPHFKTKVTVNYVFTNVLDGSYNFSGSKDVTFTVNLVKTGGPNYQDDHIKTLTFINGEASGSFDFTLNGTLKNGTVSVKSIN